MVAENRFVPISGAGFDSSGTVSLVVLMGMSGTSFIPLRCDDEGTLLTSGTN